MKNYHRLVNLLGLCTLVFLPIHSVSAASLNGLVVEIHDSGTIMVKVDDRLVKVRLCALTPFGKDHPFTETARSHLASLIKGKQIAVEYKSLDRDGTIIGIVTFGETDIAMQMIRDGAALYNRDNEDLLASHTRSLYEQCEQAARNESRGIWERTDPRSEVQSGERESYQPPNVTASLSDGAKRLNDEAYKLILEGNLKAALPRSREAVRANPHLAEARKNLALVLCDLGRYAEALPECLEAIRLKPDLDKSHNVLGKILFGLGDYEGSIRAYHEAIRLNHRYAKAHFNLGVSFREVGQLKKALAAYREADALAPNQAVVQLNIGDVLYELGQRAEARALWHKVLKMGDPIAAIRAESNLSTLR